MGLFRFPVNCPYAVSIAPSRLISDTPQVIDDIHNGRVEAMQRRFDFYQLPKEAFPIAMMQFAAVAGITSEVSEDAVAQMRAMLNTATMSRDTEPDALAVDPSQSVSRQTVHWADELNVLTDRFQAAADSLEGLSDEILRSERAIIAIETLGRLSQQSAGRGEIVLRLCASGIALDIEEYDLKASDFLSLLTQRNRFLHFFFSAIIRGLPRITREYLNEHDKLEFGYMAVWLASYSDALLHTVRHLYQLPLRATLTPLPLADTELPETMRGRCGSVWGARAARRMLRFTALEKAKERVGEIDPSLQASALQQLEEYKLV